MKNERQQAILNLVRTTDIYTQGELTQALKNAGFTVAQATISRDIRELRLIRESTDVGLKYALSPAHDESKNPLTRAFRNGLKCVDYANNIVVLRTLSGMAMAVATALDDMNFPEVLGTIAGDDTIFCVVKSEQHAADLAVKLGEIL